jgi:hypothetical protein
MASAVIWVCFVCELLASRLCHKFRCVKCEVSVGPSSLFSSQMMAKGFFCFWRLLYDLLVVTYTMLSWKLLAVLKDFQWEHVLLIAPTVTLEVRV